MPVVLSLALAWTLAAWLSIAMPLTPAQAQPVPTGECTQRTLPGEVVCVCLDPFVDPSPGADPRGTTLVLDGRPAGPPVAGTDEALFFRLPPETPLGEHRLALGGSGAGDPVTGGSAAGACTVEVVRLEAELDRERIWRGQGTPLRIRIRGTRAPVSLRLVNETPGGVTLEGGATQDATTSGGRNNSLERQVRGVTPGDFDIRWELLDATCPCGEFPGEGVFPGAGEVPVEVSGETPATETPPTETLPTETPTPETPPAEGPPARVQPPVEGLPPERPIEIPVEIPIETPPEPPTEPTETPTVTPTETPGTSVPRPTQPLPPLETTPETTIPGPEEPPRQPCASIGEEIDQIGERVTTLSEEMTFEPTTTTVPRPGVSRPTVVTPGPTGHEYCHRTYTTWARGAQAVSIHRLLTQVTDLADFCLGHGTCTPEGHRAYMEELSGLSTTLQSDDRFTTLARELPEVTASLLREYRYELEHAREELRSLEVADGGSGGSETGEAVAEAEAARRYRLRQAASQVRSWERSLEHMERWRRWSLELVAGLDQRDLLHLVPVPGETREETSP